MSDQFPRPPADDAEREACENGARLRLHPRMTPTCGALSNDGRGYKCMRQPHGDEIHVSTGNGKVLARWPQTPAESAVEAAPLPIIERARRMLAVNRLPEFVGEIVEELIAAISEAPLPGEVAALVEEARRLADAATPGPWKLHIVGPDDRQTWMIWGAPGSGGWKRAPAAPLSVAEMRAPGHEKGRANWEMMARARTLVPEMAAVLASQARDLDDARDSRDKFKAALVAEEERHMETARELDDLRADIDEHLPAYALDDGTGDKANHRERIEYAGAEIKRLRARLAEVERERDAARGEVSDVLAVADATQATATQAIRERDAATARAATLETISDALLALLRGDGYACADSAAIPATVAQVLGDARAATERAEKADREREEAHRALDAHGAPRGEASGLVYSLGWRVSAALAVSRG